MSYRRLAPFAVAGLLGFGVAGPATAAEGTASPPVVTQTANNVSVNLPGIGSLTFTVDPASGAISNVVATADPSGGFTAGTPSITDEGVQVAFNTANASSQVLQVEVEREDGVVTIKAESETDQPEQANSDDHGDGDNASQTTTTTVEKRDGEEQQPGTTPTTEVEHKDTSTTQLAGSTSTTEDNGGSHGSDDGSASSGSSSDGGQSGTGGGGQD